MIPHRLLFGWLGEQELPWYGYWNIGAWTELHPNWDVYLATERDLPDLDMSVLHVGAKSDILRYKLLDEMGGVWLDVLDLFPVGRRLDPLISSPEKRLVTGRRPLWETPGSTDTGYEVAFMAAEAGCSEIRFLREMAQHALSLLETEGSMSPVGADVLKIAMPQIENRHTVLELEPDVFYPYDPTRPNLQDVLDSLDTRYRRTLGIHTYAGSWWRSYPEEVDQTENIRLIANKLDMHMEEKH